MSCTQGSKGSTCPCRSGGTTTPPAMAAGTDPATTDPGLPPDPGKPQPSSPGETPEPPVTAPVAPVTVPASEPGISQYDDSDQVPVALSEMTRKIRTQFESGTLPVGFSLALSKLAAHLQVYQGKPLAPSSLLEMASEWGVASPWILQNYMVASGYDADFLANWIAKNLASYRNQHAISHFGFSVARRSDGADVVVLLMQRRRFTHSPFPRWVEPGNLVTVNG
ncbi:MAG: hypothetical protein CVU59_10310, partial [Deltaproteobacteria bacterium HGW-Deltaproteobacteria-17]